MSTLERPKVDVLSAMARDINPECELTIFRDGVTGSNLTQFLDGSDVYVDGWISSRLTHANECSPLSRAGIPAVTVAPLGMSGALLNFLPAGMSFEEYFQLSGLPDLEKAVRMLVGLRAVALAPPLFGGSNTCELGRGARPVYDHRMSALRGYRVRRGAQDPVGSWQGVGSASRIQFDAYRNRLAHTWRPGGNRHPLNRLAIAIAKRQLGL